MSNAFNNLVADTIKPLLKKQGFAKKDLNFYKRDNDLVFLINIQKSQGNKIKFYINCGIHSIAIDRIIGNEEKETPKEAECYFRDRISSLLHSEKDGYLIEEPLDTSALKIQLSTDLEQVTTIFNNIRSTNDLTNLMINKGGLNNYSELFTYLLLTDQQEQLKVFISKLHRQFGAEKRWTIFENKLNEILKDHAKNYSITNILST